MQTQEFKRTIAGSVGAGVGALFNGGGHTYFILEHKSSTKYHQAGEVQKIIVDQVELGRRPSCQVRFDDACETVSRVHAAIQREGDNWKLIHLSETNPTFVNGRPVQGSCILQNGDEIQLSSNGPRMGFIMPQGKQALTSSIGLTERMNLFRKQALRPYRTAITALCIALVLVVAGFSYFTWDMNKKAQAQYTALTADVEKKQRALDMLENEMEIEKKRREDEIKQAEEQGRRASLASNERIQQMERLIDEQKSALEDAIRQQEEFASKHPDVVAETLETGMSEPVSMPTPEPIAIVEETAKSDVRDYYDHIYTLKVRDIKINYNGVEIKNIVATSDIVCGTGFMMDDGTFVTARQNVEPWIYAGDLKEVWRAILAEYVAVGCSINISYDAYSSAGTARVLHFNSMDFKLDGSDDLISTTIEIRKEIRTIMDDHKIRVKYGSHHSRDTRIFSSKSKCFATIPNMGVAGEGIPANYAIASSMQGGTSIMVAGYHGNTDVHDLASYIQYRTLNTMRADTKIGTIVLDAEINDPGFYGAPGFMKDGDVYKIVGVCVGNLGGVCRLVPINRF